MKLVIDIPESIYETIKEEEVGNMVYKAIKNGTPLPRHGQICSEYVFAPTIIEADTEVRIRNDNTVEEDMQGLLNEI